MEPLDTVFEDSRFSYQQIDRQGDIAIYTQTHKPSGILRYEVVRLHIQHEHTWPNGIVTPEKEAYPGSSSWGREGWTCLSRSEAEAMAATLRAQNAA